MALMHFECPYGLGSFYLFYLLFTPFHIWSLLYGLGGAIDNSHGSKFLLAMYALTHSPTFPFIARFFSFVFVLGVVLRKGFLIATSERSSIFLVRARARPRSKEWLH